MNPSDNPYQSPSATTPLKASESPPPSQPPQIRSKDGPFVRRVQTLLRLLGVFFLVEGGGGIAGSITYGFIQASALRQAGYGVSADEYVYGWFVSSAVVFVAGLYLITSGTWLIEKVFLPASHGTDQDETHQISNSSQE